MTDTDPADDHAVAAFLTEAGHLKRTRRAGWWIAGISDPESVAEHSHRAAVIAYVLAVLEGANPDRAAALAVFHDLPETRIGDIPSTGRAHITTADPNDVIKTQTADLSGPLAASVRAVISEYEAKETPEAICAKDADKIECLIQAREYQSQGNQLVQPWIDTMISAVRTESGRRLAAVAATAPVDRWWHDIVSAYGTKPLT